MLVPDVSDSNASKGNSIPGQAQPIMVQKRSMQACIPSALYETLGRLLPRLAILIAGLLLAGCGGGGAPEAADVLDGTGQMGEGLSGGPEAQVGGLVIRGAWARSMPAGFNGAVYLELDNRGAEPVRIGVADSEVAKRVEMHETVRDGDMLRMLHQPEGIELAAGTLQRFEPGGYHIMLFDLGEALEAGQRFGLDLVAEPGGPVRVEVLVRSADEG